MAVITPPPWMQAGTYPAQTDRLALSGLLGYPGFQVDEATPTRIRQGVKPSYTNQQLKVRPAATPNMTVIVSGGFTFVDNHDAGGAGAYVCVNDADVTLTVQPAGAAGQYRRDAVIASVYDADTSGTVSEWRLEVIQGTYAATLAAAQRPSLPNNAQLLADLTISPGQTSVAAGNVSDARQFSVAAGGILPVASSVAPPRLAPGQVNYLYDLDSFEVGTLAGPKRAIREYIRPSSNTQQSAPPFTTTGSFVDFTAAAWAPITVTVPASGMVRVTIGADISNTNTASSTCWAAWRSSGAVVVGPGSYNGLVAAGGRLASSRTRLVTGATPGAALTITPQWNISSGTASTANITGGTLEVTPIP